MWIVLSHFTAFITLMIGGLYDLKTTEVPDEVSVIGVVAGILFHGVQSYVTGSWDPIIWSLSVGLIFSLYGWGLYYFGMWGGADAFAMSVLGFAAPYALTGFTVLYPANLFVNMMMIGFLYTLGFAFLRAMRSDGIRDNVIQRFKDEKLRIAAEAVLAVSISAAVGLYTALNPFVYLTGAFGIIVIYRFLKVLEDSEMVTEMPVSDLREGDVVQTPELDGKVRGITQEEIDNLEADSVKVKEGVRFVPVFPVALLITDMFGGGLMLLTALFSL
jgi:Flp pilus assembly protein protease CpaA